MTEAHEVTIKKARAAWRELKTDMTWEKWVHVGHGLVLGREDAMRDSGANAPHGRRYSKAFAAWLDANDFGDIDKGDRARLFSCMDNLAAIKEWRATLTMTERLRLNHPSSMWRRYEKTLVPKPKPTDEPPGEPADEKLADALFDLLGAEQELKRLEARVVELEEENEALRGFALCPDMSDEEIARTIFEHLWDSLGAARTVRSLHIAKEVLVDVENAIRDQPLYVTVYPVRRRDDDDPYGPGWEECEPNEKAESYEAVLYVGDIEAPPDEHQPDWTTAKVFNTLPEAEAHAKKLAVKHKVKVQSI